MGYASAMRPRGGRSQDGAAMPTAERAKIRLDNYCSSGFTSSNPASAPA